MMFVGAGLRSVAVVVRNDAAQLCCPLNLALIHRRKIDIKNVVADLLALMGPREIVVREPLPVDMVKVIKAQTDKVVKALRF